MNPHIVPASQHTLFMRGFHPNTEMNRIRDFFSKEGGKCSFDFFKVSQDASRLFVALRFESREVAKDILSRFDNSTVLGSKIAITWFKDLRRARLKAIQHGQQWNYRYNSRNGYNRNFNKYGSYNRMKSTVWQRRSSKDYEARRGSSSSRSRSRSRSRSHYSRSRSRSYSRTRSRSRSRSRSSSPSRSRSHSRNRSASPRPHRPRSHSSSSSRGSSHEQPGSKYWKDNEPQPPPENDKPKESDSGNQPEAREEGEVNSETQGDGMEGVGSANEKGEVEKRNKRSRSSSLEFLRKPERSSSRSSTPSDPSDPKERRKKKKKHRRSKHHRHHRRHSRRRHRSSSDEGQKSDFDAEQLERMCRLGGSQEPSNPISVHHMDGMDDEELELLMNLPSKEDSPKSPRMADAVSRESDGMSPLHVSEGDDEPNDSIPKLIESQIEINSVEKEQKNDLVVNNIPSAPVEPEEKERDVPVISDNNSLANVNSDTNAVSEEKTSPKIGKITSVKINPSSKSLLEKYKSSLKHQVPTPATSLKKLSFKQKKSEDEPEKSKSIFPTKEVNSNAERSTQLSEFQITRIKMKKAEMEETYRQDTETFATVVKMLISKDPSLEEKVQYSLRENLRDIARRCINELQEFIDTIHDS